MFKISKSESLIEKRALPEECPVSISLSGTSHAVMMASPYDLEEFAFGFLCSEAIISSASDVQKFYQHETALGIDLQLELKPKLRDQYMRLRRNMLGPVGCGLCGAENIEIAFENLPEVEPKEISRDFPWQALNSLQRTQQKRDVHGALHAASLFDKDGNHLCTREDIGRHNALDKVIGHAILNKIEAPTALVTSRISADLIMKALRANISNLLGRATPSDLAVEMSKKHGLNLIAPIFEDAYYTLKDIK